MLLRVCWKLMFLKPQERQGSHLKECFLVNQHCLRLHPNEELNKQILLKEAAMNMLNLEIHCV
ncbi:hypothetical protein SLEP1_g2744 [Rubroshorea leprosula]|uniref:Uncharacterized protein n=1 Tax=Rubroshorea leprosula TaxID=152421 RepID=A0AAV5HSC1_9ROSI|nr:hypothetical protein SLEP1_g2744 [Rubroshorea leprosula]